MAKRQINKNLIEHAIAATGSNREAAGYLGVSLNTYKSYASRYIDDDTGKTLYEKHKTQSGNGIKKPIQSGKDLKKWEDLITGAKLAPTWASTSDLKKGMIESGFLVEECASCGFSGSRVTDGKSPIVLTFKDKDKRNWKMENLHMVCYNCYFLEIGEVFSKMDLSGIGTGVIPRKKQQLVKALPGNIPPPPGQLDYFSPIHIDQLKQARQENPDLKPTPTSSYEDPDEDFGLDLVVRR